MQPQTTAREVVDDTIPGGLNVFIQTDNPTVGTESGDVLSLNLDQPDSITVTPGEALALSVVVRNEASTDAGGPFSSPNPDNCGIDNDGDGTTITAVAEPSFGPTATETQCMKDNGFGRDPAESQFTLSLTAPTTTGTFPVEVYAQGGNTGTRLTPIYAFDVVATNDDDNGGDDPSDDPDDSGDPTQPVEPYIDSCATRGIAGGIAVDVIVTAEDTGTLSLPITVNGQQIIAPTRSYSPGDNTFTVEIPTSEMPVGQAMPVEIGVA